MGFQVYTKNVLKFVQFSEKEHLTIETNCNRTFAPVIQARV